MNALSRKATIILLLPGAIHFSGGLADSREPETASSLNLELSPAFDYRSVDGDERKFREDQWKRENLSGGLENFLLEKSFGEDWLLRLEGQAIVPEEDYKFLLDIRKEDLGFFRTGYTEYRKYFDDTGGFFRPFSTPVFHLNKDMYLDIGNFFLEAGTTIPDLPRIVVGYEHRFKEGEKSLLAWGSVSEGASTRKIFPSFKEVDDNLDIFKVEVEHDIGKVHAGDRFRYERYKTGTTRFEQERDLDAGRSETVNVSERYNHDAIFNTFHLESHLNEKIYLSFGYLLNDLEGDAAFCMMTAPFGPEPFDKNWFSRSVGLDQKSHVLNLNTLVGPYRRLSFHGGIQAELTETEGDTDAVLTETAFGGGVASPEAQIRSRMDKNGLEETVGIRYSGIPYTSLYAEGKWTQQDIELFEREMEDAGPAFERFTDTEVDRRRYTFGFNSSPFRRFTISGRYRRSYRENVYDHKKDTEPGYSAFMNNQELHTNEIATKVTARITGTVKAAFQYQHIKTKIGTLSQTTPSSSVDSGHYVADIYSVSVTATPISSLYLTGLFSYRDANSESFDNGSASVIAYNGDVYSFIGTAGWAFGKKTDVTLEYLYSRSDNFQNNSANALPLGVDHKRHGLSLGCSRKINDRVQARFRYGFYKYEEERNAGVDDYGAHLLGVRLEVKF
jgi:hypothetical protein